MINNVTMGSDIEVVIQTLLGQPFPVCGIVGGTKEKPRALGGGYFIQEDNVLLEFNIPVAASGREFVSFVNLGLRKSLKELPPSLGATEVSTAIYDEVYIKSIQKASEFGCEPDYNAWKEEQNPKPSAKNPYLRSAAAHVHIGWTDPQPEDQLNLIKWADIFVSLPSVWESKDRTRRELYGKAGAFRPKEYGVEHRVLDNYWIWDMAYINAVYQRYGEAIDAVNKNKQIVKADENQIQQAINTYDVQLAKRLYKKYKYGAS
jgi:hypothetical protein